MTIPQRGRFGSTRLVSRGMQSLPLSTQHVDTLVILTFIALMYKLSGLTLKKNEK